MVVGNTMHSSTSRMDAAAAATTTTTTGKELLQLLHHHVSSSEKEQQFPHKLYTMLESVDSLGLSHTVSWLPDGRSFSVNDPAKFMDLVVPQFFKATKFRSFQRQLNLWGFSRIAKGRDNRSWYHESFIRGCPAQLSSIFRTKIKGNGHITSHKHKQAPNSHLIPSLSADSIGIDIIEEEVFQASDCYSFVSACTLQDSNATSLEASFSDDVFDEKVKALFSVEDPLNLNVARRVTIDEGCRPIDVMSLQPRVPNNVSESNTAELARTTTRKTINWDTLFIEPLSVSSINVFETDTHTDLDEFHTFLGRLIM